MKKMKRVGLCLLVISNALCMEPNPEESSQEETASSQELITNENITALLLKRGYLIHDTLQAANVGLQNIEDIATNDQLFAYASELKVMVLRNNSLTSIPENITTFSNLEHLDVSFNQLTSIPECIGTLTNLKNLNLSNNTITELPPSITQLMKLNTLWISHNNIETIPSLRHMSELKYILAANTLIKATVDGENKSLFPANAFIIELDTVK